MCPPSEHRKIGFYGIFSISATLYLIAFFYGVFFLPEVDIVSEKDRLKAKEKNMLLDFFDKEHVMETFRVAFKKGERQRRLRVIMLMIVVMVVIGPLHGECHLEFELRGNACGGSEEFISPTRLSRVIRGNLG